MAKGMRRAVLIGVAVVAVLLLLVGSKLHVALEVGTGYSAKRLCSETFVAGRDKAVIVSEDLAIMPLPMTHTIDNQAHTATSSAFGVSQTAAWRPTLGCALTNGTTVEAVQSMGFEIPRQDHAGKNVWPSGEKIVSVHGKDVDDAKMAAALDFAFEEPDPENMRRTRAVVVLYKGELVAERYAEGFNKQTPLLGWSMTKSVIHALIGVAVEKKGFDIKAPAPISEWAGTKRADITTDQLLRMSSGLTFDEDYGPFGDATAMLFTARDSASHAARFGLAHPPDTHWSYSSGTSNILSRIARDLAGDLRTYHTDAHTQLFDAFDARSAVLETDPSGTFVGSSFLYMTARDWARFGLLYAQDGVWNGKRVLPKGWAKHACTPTPPSKGVYGGQWWLNKGTPKRYPSLPDDACAAHGFETQRVIVIPSRETVIVRLGLTQKRGTFDVDRFAGMVMAALPAAKRGSRQ